MDIGLELQICLENNSNELLIKNDEIKIPIAFRRSHLPCNDGQCTNQ
jgi:hypothetical protein